MRGDDMELNKKVYRTEFQTQNDFEKYSEEMQNYCIINNLELTYGIDEDGAYWQIIPSTPIPLEDVKANKIAELKALRDAKELEPITFNGYRFDFDKDAIMRMQLAERSLRGTDATLTWTDADNNRVNNVNADDLNAILVQGTIRSNELHIRYNELKALVNQANSVDDVNAIAW